ncbi:Putative papain-like cysteine peptidase [Paenibacillus sp. UNCCL117]|uniref:DUF1796 family putative cysteine peptidase n=1 Tax=unclassified Paenibacillus TaxID=185978 RepID=UPI0008868043|nr:MULTISPECIES: DUF1796 family putative cysteine peptidase [unclassified Paenibacillus]SDD30702.1 Putative papain-like cysteine peptidase [Paenibacillus sp. cl123]SFW40290.1 Putative papain-like cysteine peptidase [Paenibacillus sp. UNCCL117]
MRLSELAGTYDAVFSLGQNCTPAIQLEKNGLRPFAGVLDWMMSDTLADVNRLLLTRFGHFMEWSDLQVMSAGYKSYMVKDLHNNVISVHDFPLSKNTEQHLATYGEFKEKLNRRIARFYEKAGSSQRILFVRLLGAYEEVRELQAILRSIVAHDFTLLIVNYTGVTGLTEIEWGLNHVCVVEIPSADLWNYASDPYWEQMFKGVSLR